MVNRKFIGAIDIMSNKKITRIRKATFEMPIQIVDFKSHLIVVVSYIKH